MYDWAQQNLYSSEYFTQISAFKAFSWGLATAGAKSRQVKRMRSISAPGESRFNDFIMQPPFDVKITFRHAVIFTLHMPGFL
jgi:hypothetical protein